MLLRRTLLTAATAAAAAPALAQPAWPARAVRLILPDTAGSGNDTTARLFSPLLEAALGQPFVPDNRGGAVFQTELLGLELHRDQRTGVERDHGAVGAEGDCASLVHGGEAASDSFDPTAAANPFEGQPVNLHRLAAARVLQGALHLTAEHLEIDRSLRQAPGKRADRNKNGKRRKGEDLDKESPEGECRRTATRERASRRDL